MEYRDELYKEFNFIRSVRAPPSGDEIVNVQLLQIVSFSLLFRIIIDKKRKRNKQLL